jgi:hypothetical protein
VTRIDVVRRIAADPASLALLLAGPAAGELWPDVAAMPALVPSQPSTRVTISMEPPVRSGLGFVAHLQFHRAERRVARGRLVVVASAVDDRGDDHKGTSELRLTASCEDAFAQQLRSDGVAYLANLATVAEARSSAA